MRTTAGAHLGTTKAALLGTKAMRRKKLRRKTRGKEAGRAGRQSGDDEEEEEGRRRERSRAELLVHRSSHPIRDLLRDARLHSK